MKTQKLSLVLIFSTLLCACSSNDSDATVASNEPTIIPVDQACSMLNLEMTNWKSSMNDGVYRCISNYIDISPDQGLDLPNNLAYYVQGTENTVTELKVVLNVNDKKFKRKAKEEFIKMSSNVYSQVKAGKFPPAVIKAITAKRDYSTSDEKLSYTLDNDIWKNGKGYTQRFIIHLK